MDVVRNWLGKLYSASWTDVTGTWCGHYWQHSTRCRLECVLKHQGSRVTGTMRDLDRTSQQSLLEAVAGLPPGADEQLAEQIYPLFPGQPRGPITVHSELPEHSTLQGSVDHYFVRFTKTYQGKSSFGYRMNGQIVKHATSPLPIEYTGRLSPDFRTISGQWTIYDQSAAKGYVEGLFELVRV